MIFGSLFITNLFIEVVINTFDKEKNKIDRNFMLTEFQKEWIQVQLKCYEHNPKTQIYTESSLRRFCLAIVNYKHFEPIIIILILLNACVLTFVWVDIDQVTISYTENL